MTADDPIPSRFTNPFATCWTRPDALPYVASTEQLAPETLVDRLESVGGRAQLVGPHGAGKSTLLAELGRVLERRGVEVTRLDLTRGDPTPALRAAGRTLCLVEGFERTSSREQRRQLRQWRRDRLRFVVTTHRTVGGSPWRLPVLARLAPNPELVLSLLAQLTQERSSPVTRAEALQSFGRRGGNLREVWFDLYDLHERRIRQGRTVSVRVA